MKMMIWKELRENFKWAFLALLGLAIAEIYALSSVRVGSMDYYNGLTVCGPTFLLVTSFGCAAVGAALGVVQILPELRRDQWAALLHRPVSRGVIFFGKVLAGVLLYLFATLLPFLASAAYVAAPGQFASPLVPGMMLPGFSDIFLGLVFYFAAILLCLHRGRWFGSRGIIGLSVLPVFLLHLAAGWPFLLPVLAAVILFLAAWGTMQSNGRVQSRLGAARTALVLIVLTGAETAWLILVFGLQFLPAPASAYPTYGEFEITRDGQVFISTQQGDDSARVLTDTSGKVVADERYVGNNSGRNFLQLLPFANIGSDFTTPEIYLTEKPRNLRNYIQPVQQNYYDKENWYLLIRQNYFIGYDKLSRRCVGICDVDGFKPAGAAPKPFPLRLQTYDFWSSSPHHYWSGTQLYALDFPERSMAAPYNAREDAIHGAMNLVDPAHPDKPNQVAVALKSDVLIFDPQGKPLVTIPYGHDPAIWSDLWLGSNPALGRFYLQFTQDYLSRFLSPGGTAPSAFLDEIDSQGNLVHTYSHPGPGFTLAAPGWMSRLSTYSSPFLPALLATTHDHLFPSKAPAYVFGEAAYPGPSLHVSAGDILMLLAGALVLGGFTLFWARRVGFSAKRGWFWALFVFCFGLPGLLTFRLASDWPTRVRCPQCGRRRPIETEECPSCHQLWPPRHSTGAEIFDLEKVKI